MRPKLPRRHPAEVTLCRLGQHSIDYYDLLDGNEREAIGLVINALDEIAEGRRGTVSRACKTENVTRKPPASSR